MSLLSALSSELERNLFPTMRNEDALGTDPSQAQG